MTDTYEEAVKLTAKQFLDDFKEINEAVPKFMEYVGPNDVDVWTHVTGTSWIKTFCVDVPPEYEGDVKQFKAFRSFRRMDWCKIVTDTADEVNHGFTDDRGWARLYHEYPYQDEFEDGIVAELEKLFEEAGIELNGSIVIEHDFEFAPASTSLCIYFEMPEAGDE